MQVHFVIPQLQPAELEDLISRQLEVDYPYWLGGPINWAAQSYLILREFRENLSIGTEPSRTCANVAHVTGWRILPRRGEFRISIRADYRRLFDVDFEILQNPLAVVNDRQAFVAYWPVPRLLPRNSQRDGVRVIAYAGRLGARNIDPRFRLDQASSFQDAGIQFVHIPKDRWHDLREVDVLFGVRSFDRAPYLDKPPSKLLNAWHAGIPFVGGYDAAFSAIGRPGVDYIRVETCEQATQAIHRLRDDREFYRSVVEAGSDSASQYTREAIAKQWLKILDGPLHERFVEFREQSRLSRLQQLVNRGKDVASDAGSRAKRAILRLKILHGTE
jgi:hypothetical protein